MKLKIMTTSPRDFFISTFLTLMVGILWSGFILLGYLFDFPLWAILVIATTAVVPMSFIWIEE